MHTLREFRHQTFRLDAPGGSVTVLEPRMSHNFGRAHPILRRPFEDTLGQVRKHLNVIEFLRRK